jgi:tRNA(Ile)-lysidine synthase
MTVHALLQQVQSFITLHDLCGPTDKILVALSGGIDSMALAHILRQLNYAIAVAHCNFQLRGVAADEDAAFVAQHFHAYRIQTWLQAFDTKAYAQDHQVSIQVAARDLRYAWLQEIAAQHGFDKIALAHHLDDQAETIIYDLVRGQHFATLQGIPVQRAPFIRPLLQTPKQALVDFLAQHDLAWREDASNASIDYDRNFIRHRVLPQLAELNPSVAAHLVQRLADYQEQQNLLNHSLAAMEPYWVRCHSSNRYSIVLNHPTGKANETDPNPQFFRLFLRYWLAQHLKFSVAAIGQVMQLLGSDVGAWTAHDNWRVIRDRGELTLSQQVEAVTESGENNPSADKFSVTSLPARIDVGPVCYFFSARPYDPAVNLRHLPANTYWLDRASVSFPLSIRRWQAGDKMQPFGMQGVQLVADILTNLKAPPDQRADRWVILDAQERIIFLQGFRMADFVKVRPATLEVLEIVVN